MKWFRHDSDALDDPFVQGLLDEFGATGYLVWFGLLEIISKENGAKLTGEITVSPAFLCRKFRMSEAKVSRVLHYCDTNGRLSISKNLKTWMITCHKLLKLNDNYSRHLQVTDKRLARMFPYVTVQNKQQQLTTTTDKSKDNAKGLLSGQKTLEKNSLGAVQIARVLTSYGVRPDQVDKWLREYGTDRLALIIKEVAGQGAKIGNPGGYIAKVLKRRRPSKVSVNNNGHQQALEEIPDDLKTNIRIKARAALGVFASASEQLVEVKMIELWRQVQEAKGDGQF